MGYVEEFIEPICEYFEMPVYT